MRNLRVAWLKRRLKVAYLDYVGILDGFSCGYALANNISPRVGQARKKVNKIIRKLKLIDPKCKLKEIAA